MSESAAAHHAAESKAGVLHRREDFLHRSSRQQSEQPRVVCGQEAGIDPQRLLVQRAKFSAHVMVSAGVSFAGKGRLHFVPDKTKIDANYYVNNLLPSLVDDCENLMPGDFIFQQDGAPAHTARLTQDWLAVNCPDFMTKDEWPPNSPDLNPLDYHVWGAMLQKYQEYNPKPTTADELKAALQTIWDELPQQSVENSILALRKRLQVCIEAKGRHIEHLLD
jgi:hypothetical protein